MTPAVRPGRASPSRLRASWLALALLSAATTSAAATFNYFPTPIDVSPGVAGAWTDVDVSASVPAGATGVIVQWVNVAAGADVNYGVRMKGSADNWAFDGEAKDQQQGWLMTGLDASRVFQVFTGNTAVKTYLVGYTMWGVKFFTNRIDKSTATTGSWVDVGIAADTGSETAIGAIFHVDCTAGSSINYGLRKKGSTDNRIQGLRANMMNVGLIGVDASETAQQQIATTQIDLYLVGYVTSGAVFFTNAIDKSTATTGAYVDVDLSADVGAASVANGAFLQVFPSSGTRRLTALRPNGASYDYYTDVSNQDALVGLDAGQVFEQKIELSTQDLYLVGYSLADGTPTFRVKSGSYMGTGGALSITGVGFQPDVVIVDGVGGGADTVIKTSSMSGANSKQLDNGVAFSTARIVSLDADGFSLGTDPDVNQNGITYYWVAMKAAPGAMKVGTYAGAAGALNVTGVGFTPDYVVVLSPNASDWPMQRSSLMPANFCLDFAGAGYSNSILNTQPNGFGLGTHDVTGVGITFHYVAWARTPGKIALGSYAGDNADSRNIGGTGFQPEYLIVNRSSDVGGATGTSVGNAPAHKTAASGTSTDGATLFNGNVAEVDNIQALQADGFQVGTHCRVNGNGAPVPCNTPAPVAYYWIAFGPHASQVYFRSIGTAADFSNQGTLTVTAGSTVVAKVGGAGWKGANRGRGDRLTVGTDHYMILSVDSDDTLRLATPAVNSYTGSSYTIARQFTTLQGWENCVSRSGANTCKRPADTQEYFATATASLIADDRSEVGIAYKESAFGKVNFNGASTDANHTITLTADPGHRHLGVAGAGVIVDGAAAALANVLVQDDFVTIEWLEIKGGTDEGIEFQNLSLSPGPTNRCVVRNLLVHNTAKDGILVDAATANIDAYNNIVYATAGSSTAGIWVGTALTTGSVRVFNNTVYGNTRGIVAAGSNPGITLRNNLALGNPSGDYNVAGRNAASSNNLSTDASGTVHSPAGGGLDSVTATASPTTCPSGTCVGFFNITPGSENLHLIATTYTNRALDAGANLGPPMAPFDIDAQGRVAPWDAGADDFGGTTAVKLMSFDATAGDAEVRLVWRTGSELDNLGFHVYRGTSANGPWERLTQALIPGLGSSPVGKSYAWTDGGLHNGSVYFYRLEDVDASSRATSHGPVSAVPQAGAPAGEEPEDGRGRRRKAAAGGACPAWVLAAHSSPSGLSGAAPRCTRHGNPEATSLSLTSHDSRQALVELRTGGFYALHEPGGSVRVFVPGFDFPQDERAAALPLRRALVDAVVGRRVRLAGVRASDLAVFPGLVPSAVGAAELQASWDGTVRAARRGGRLAARAAASEVARLLPSVFQGEAKSAVVELLPLRFDPQRQRIVLAKTLRVRLQFAGREPAETGSGTRGRAPARRTGAEPAGEMLARLHTTSRGLYAVAFEQLFAGQARALAASELRLQRQGAAVAFHVEPDRDRFGPGSRLFFFADSGPASTDFAGEVAFELVRSRDGRRMARASAEPGGAPLATASLGSAAFEVNRFYQPGLLEAPDPWLWEALPTGATRTLSATLAGVDPVAATAAAELEVYLQGASESGTAVDHHVRVSVNGAAVGETRFAGKRPHDARFAVPAALLRNGANEVVLTSVGDTGVTSLVFLDRFAFAFPQHAAAASGRFEGAWAESGAAAVSVAEPPVALLELPAGAAAASGPSWLSGYQAGALVRFRAEAERRYLLVTSAGALAPRVTRPQPSTLRSAGNQADYLLIAPRAFLPAAEPLLTRRSDQGLEARGVAAEEIYESFGHGQPSAEAIRAFVAFAFQSWAQPSPRYVVLLGDASYDPRNFMGTSPAAPLPALFAKTSYLLTAVDPHLAAVNGDDLLPDLAIGRLPAATAEQAVLLVQKLLAWEDSAQGIGGRATLVADNPDLAGDFEANVADIASSFLAERQPELLRLSELGASLRPRILDSLNGGLSLLSYVGHGGAAVWASENVWNSWDAASLQAQSIQPLLLTWNCLNGYFVAPAFDSLAESLVKAEGRGAIAAVSPSGLSLDAQAHQYHRAFIAELTSGRHARLGDAFLAAQTAYARTGLMPELLSIYHLFGDPATAIR